MGLCVGSLDVKALYPSLAIDACAKIAHDRVLKSGIKFRDISKKWATVYLALNMKTHEIVRAELQHLIPTRRAKSGKPPTVLTIEVDQKNEKRNEEEREKGREETPGRWRWFSDPEKATEEETQRIMAKVVEVMIKACFESHMYKWGDTFRRQRSGGAIGLRATGALAKVTMDK